MAGHTADIEFINQSPLTLQNAEQPKPEARPFTVAFPESHQPLATNHVEDTESSSYSNVNNTLTADTSVEAPDSDQITSADIYFDANELSQLYFRPIAS